MKFSLKNWILSEKYCLVPKMVLVLAHSLKSNSSFHNARVIRLMSENHNFNSSEWKLLESFECDEILGNWKMFWWEHNFRNYAKVRELGAIRRFVAFWDYQRQNRVQRVSGLDENLEQVISGDAWWRGLRRVTCFGFLENCEISQSRQLGYVNGRGKVNTNNLLKSRLAVPVNSLSTPVLVFIESN